MSFIKVETYKDTKLGSRRLTTSKIIEPYVKAIATEIGVKEVYEGLPSIEGTHWVTIEGHRDSRHDGQGLYLQVGHIARLVPHPGVDPIPTSCGVCIRSLRNPTLYNHCSKLSFSPFEVWSILLDRNFLI